MKYLWVLFFVSWCSVVTAQDAADVRVQVIDNKNFVCFTEHDAKILLDMRLKTPSLEELTSVLKEQVGVKEKELLKMAEMNTNQQQQLTVLTNMNVQCQQQLASQTAWYRSPILWFIVGAVVAGTVAGVAVHYSN